MTEKEYRSHPAISRSELWWLDRSPEYFQYRKNTPMEPTAALLFGQVAHKLLLEPDSFDDDFAVAPYVDRRTKAGKELWESFIADAGEKTIVDAATYDQAADMIAAARLNPLVNDLLAGEHEKPLFWTDPDTGVECKCRLDAIIRDDDGVPVIVDYKTTTDCSTKAFLRDVCGFGYFFQAAMYSEGVIQNGMCPRLIKEKPRKHWRRNEETGKREYYTETPTHIAKDDEEGGEIIRPKWVFIVQEKSEPYSLNVFEMDQDFILAGYDTFRELLGTYVSCESTGFWYGPMGPFNEPQILTMPTWFGRGNE